VCACVQMVVKRLQSTRGIVGRLKSFWTSQEYRTQLERTRKRVEVRIFDP
jgi:hypothetical protein